MPRAVPVVDTPQRRAFLWGQAEKLGAAK
jgi:hypothetical protein